jgi:transposase
MTSMTQHPESRRDDQQSADEPARAHRRLMVGVDTHKYVHVAVALDEHGARVGELSIAVDAAGYRLLEAWASGLGQVLAFGVEGTGSYGAALASMLRRHGHRVVEVARPDRRDRRLRGKNDLLDAENAARSVLAQKATATPKTHDGAVEMMRQIKVAKDTAVKARTAAMICLKTLLVTAPPELREQLEPLSKAALLERCAALRPGAVTSPLAAAKHALRAMARRWRDLDVEIKEHEALLAALTRQVAPQLVEAFGIGPDTAAEVLIVAGDNPARVRSEGAWARMCGVAPIPASSGTTTRHRLHRGGHRQANAALYRAVIVRMQHHEPTRAYVARRTAEGRTKAEIIRCLKRYLAREIWSLTRHLRSPATTPPTPS